MRTSLASRSASNPLRVRVATRGFAAFELASLRLGAVAPTVRNIEQAGLPVVIPRDIQQRQTPPPERAADAAATAAPVRSQQPTIDNPSLPPAPTAPAAPPPPRRAASFTLSRQALERFRAEAGVAANALPLRGIRAQASALREQAAAAVVGIERIGPTFMQQRDLFAAFADANDVQIRGVFDAFREAAAQAEAGTGCSADALVTLKRSLQRVLHAATREGGLEDSSLSLELMSTPGGGVALASGQNGTVITLNLRNFAVHPDADPRVLGTDLAATHAQRAAPIDLGTLGYVAGARMMSDPCVPAHAKHAMVALGALLFAFTEAQAESMSKDIVKAFGQRGPEPVVDAIENAIEERLLAAAGATLGGASPAGPQRAADVEGPVRQALIDPALDWCQRIASQQARLPSSESDAAASATIGPIASGQMHHDLQTLANPGARAAFAQAPITASVLSDLYFRANPP